MNIFIFSKKAEKDFLKLEKNDQKRVLEKLKELKNHINLISVLKKVVDLEPATHRLRIWKLRLIWEFNYDKNEFFILKVWDRKNVYF